MGVNDKSVKYSSTIAFAAIRSILFDIYLNACTIQDKNKFNEQIGRLQIAVNNIGIEGFYQEGSV